jgi:DNA repair protein RecN (Recombination protein N)
VKSSDEDWREIGFDDVEFFFSANAGEQPKSLARTASGGELSRVMLALKTLGTTDVARKTLVFDEVDAGVGGEAAERIGRRLARLGEDFQVLSVTHAPQVAIHGDEHFIVRKSDESGRTVTTINKLVIEKERAAELSRLMTGAVDSVGIDTAMALLRVRRKAKAKGESRKDG